MDRTETKATALPLTCPACGQKTESLKCFSMIHTMFCLVFYMSARGVIVTACPACMRRALLKRTLINILPANIAWLFGVFPLHLVYFARTHVSGHSSRVRRALSEAQRQSQRLAENDREPSFPNSVHGRVTPC